MSIAPPRGSVSSVRRITPRAPRTSASFPIRVILDGTEFRAILQNHSETGACVYGLSVEPGCVLTIVLSGKERRGRVCWSRARRVGIQFLEDAL